MIIVDVCVPGHGGQGVCHPPQVAVAGAGDVPAAERLLHQRLASPGPGGVPHVTGARARAGEQAGEIVTGQRAGHHPAQSSCANNLIL